MLETKCHLSNPKPATKCDVRQKHEHAVEGDCDIKMQKENGSFIVQDMKCKSKPDSREDGLGACVGCDHLLPLNDTEVAYAVDVSFSQFKSPDNQTYFQVAEISRATLKVVRGHMYKTEFVIVATNCSEQDHKENCVPLTGKDQKYGFCSGVVVKDALGGEDASLKCEVYDPQPGSSFVPLVSKVVPGHPHHDLRYSNLGTGSLSSESSSAEALSVVPVVPVPTAANPIVKRSLLLVDNPSIPVSKLLPKCPGQKRFF
ncbi:alpha-2-HS-glycoprotein-like [Rhinatrema bivittatum]|uniref:alpha-2-HS-glycoprotein-like n=1 Tax=Rhinatrema bivittatum TaxID=194408 RepID=UPI0011292331|nr:alpha-2-HS-glycoprotein-like [Rhinatrema bivittatum]